MFSAITTAIVVLLVVTVQSFAPPNHIPFSPRKEEPKCTGDVIHKCEYSFVGPSAQLPPAKGVNDCCNEFNKWKLSSEKSKLELEWVSNWIKTNSAHPRQPAVALPAVNYVRFGHWECPLEAELIYSGFIGKSRHLSPGGGLNHLCLPKDPDYYHYSESKKHQASTIFGTEYRTNNSPFFPPKRHNLDAYCAVCEAKNKTQVLMVPAKRYCPKGWNKEYVGYLMAEHAIHKSGSDFICVDLEMQGSPNSGYGKGDGGSYLYAVVGRRGSVPCPPYKDGQGLSCVVCTK